jgi:hypothetical protein
MITDIVESLPNANGSAIRLTELGKIKIGGLGAERSKSGGGGTYRLPVKYDHFIITTLQRGPDRNGARGDLLPDETLMQTLAETLGDPGDGKLRQIPIRVLSDDIDDVLQAAFVWYGGKTVCARSDGKEVTWFVDIDASARAGKVVRLREPRVEAWKPEFLELAGSGGNKLFKLHAVLNCVIAAKESRWGGVYKLRTTSLITFKQLYASLLHIHQLTGGVLVGMPLMLVVRPVQVAPEGKPTTVYVVHVELRGAELMDIQRQALTQAQWMLENRQQLLSVRTQYRKLLVGPGMESQEESGEIAEEFQPETQTVDAAPESYDIIDGTGEAGAGGSTDVAEGEDASQPEPPQEFQEPQVDLVEEAMKQDAAGRRASLRARAKDRGTGRKDFEGGYFKFVQRHGGDENQISLGDWCEFFRAIDQRRFDFKAGASVETVR